MRAGVFESPMQLDLKSQARADGAFQSELFKRQKRLEQLEQLALRDSAYVQQFQESFYELLQYCEFNTSFLAPYFWPAYPKYKPMAFVDYPFAIHMFDILVGGCTVIRGSRQISKSTSFACRQQMVARMLPGF